LATSKKDGEKNNIDSIFVYLVNELPQGYTNFGLRTNLKLVS